MQNLFYEKTLQERIHAAGFFIKEQDMPYYLSTMEKIDGIIVATGRIGCIAPILQLATESVKKGIDLPKMILTGGIDTCLTLGPENPFDFTDMILEKGLQKHFYREHLVWEYLLDRYLFKTEGQGGPFRTQEDVQKNRKILLETESERTMGNYIHSVEKGLIVPGEKYLIATHRPHIKRSKLIFEYALPEGKAYFLKCGSLKHYVNRPINFVLEWIAYTLLLTDLKTHEIQKGDTEAIRDLFKEKPGIGRSKSIYKAFTNIGRSLTNYDPLTEDYKI